MKKKRITALAKSLGWNVYKNSNNTYAIEIPLKNKEILLLKEESPNRWLLISNQMPQAILKTEEVSKLIKELKKKF